MFIIAMPVYSGLVGYILIGVKFSAGKKGWNKYSFSLPVSNFKRIGAGYIIAAIVSFTAFLMTLGMTLILKIVIGNFIQTYELVFMLAIFSNMLSYILIAALYALKSKWKVMAYGLVLLSLLGIDIFIDIQTGSLGYTSAALIVINWIINTVSYMLSHKPHLILLAVPAVAMASLSVALLAVRWRDDLC
jgi:hypothetical protein